jgi:hypothetical protein
LQNIIVGTHGFLIGHIKLLTSLNFPSFRRPHRRRARAGIEAYHRANKSAVCDLVWYLQRKQPGKPKDVSLGIGFLKMSPLDFVRLLEEPCLLAEYRASVAMGNDERAMSGGDGRLDGERRKTRWD